MSQVNDDFLSYWNKRFPDLPAIGEYRPQRDLYDSEARDEPYRKWLSYNNYADYQLDFCLVDYALGAEFDGEGAFSHSGRGSIRDKLKDNQMLRLGYITLRFPARTVKESPAYVADEIREVLNVFFLLQ